MLIMMLEVDPGHWNAPKIKCSGILPFQLPAGVRSGYDVAANSAQAWHYAVGASTFTMILIAPLDFCIQSAQELKHLSPTSCDTATQVMTK
jgi:hypothetical protein